MGNKRNERKPIIFGSCKEVLQTVIMFFFAANLVFGDEESKFCTNGWSEFVEDREQWEKGCLNEYIINMSHCCKRTAEYLEERYDNYIKLCPIVEGNCVCHFQERRIDRITRNKMSDPVSWAKPMITCTHKFQINLYKVEPNVKSPQRFPAGLNNIKYNFTLYGGKTVSCTILVYVRSCNSSEKEEIAERNGNKRDCKKDILVLWDISNYVNSAYIDVLKEFLKKFIKSEKLRVEEQGTHLGFASFSSDNRTRELLEVGEIKNKTLLMQWLDRIDFENNPSVNTAFKNMAKNPFKETSPKNFRPDVEDVILLLTSSAHESSENQTKLVDEYTTILSKKNFTIVRLAVGNEFKKLKLYINGWSSPERIFELKLDELDKVVNETVDASCTLHGGCECRDSVNYEFTAYAKPNEIKGLVHWSVPELTCSDYERGQVHPPDVRSPANFSLGKHVITYPYSYKRNNKTIEFKCFVNLTVIACDCPCTQTVNSEVEEDQDKKILVSWTEPKPRCPATPNPANPKLIGLFSIGIYTLYYYYTYSDKYGTFGIQCHVRIAVTAYITLRLQGSLSKNGTGRVEVFFNRQWGTICAHGWDLRDARVVCRQLGYKDAVRAPYGAQVPDGSGQIWLDEVGCKGMEKNLISCSHRGWGKHDCTHYEDAGVECVSTDIPADITLRLQGSSSKNGTGRVEVFFKGEWGTICDYGWDFKDARVVCRQLGYQDAVRALQGGQVPHGSGRIWLAAVGCKGMEQNLISCVVHRGWGDHYCMHTEDAGLECVSPVCICPWTQIVKAEVRKGETKVLVSWSKPVPSCQTTASPDNPQTTSGWFCVGEHTLIYKYTRSTSSYITDILCHVEIHVTGKDCGRTDYNQITHVCCCGEVHRKKSDFKCCGTEYYNPNNKKCCRGGIVVTFGERCP